jgi:hypothetical protein
MLSICDEPSIDVTAPGEQLPNLRLSTSTCAQCGPFLPDEI